MRNILLTLTASAFILSYPSPIYAETISASVPIPPPTQAPTIDAPLHLKTFSEKHITAQGSCIVNLVVKIFNNSTFTGSALCNNQGQFQLPIDLQEGENELVAHQYDALWQPSPDSSHVVVYFVPTAELPSLTSSPQPATTTFALRLHYDYTLQSVFVNQPFRLPIKFVGGQPPYAIHIDWDDQQSSLLSRDDTSELIMEHTYKNSGTYTVKIKLTDHQGAQAYLQFVLIVNGAITLGSALQNPLGNLHAISTALPFFLPSLAVVGGVSVFGGVLLGKYWPVFKRFFNFNIRRKS